MSQDFKPGKYFKPKDQKEVSALLNEYGEKARIIAGGTGIYELAHRGLLSEVEALIDISSLGLSYIRDARENDGSNSLHIGACTTMSSLARSKDIVGSPELAALSDALKLIQPLQVKNVATIAGAVCTALPFFDLPVALITLDASVRLAPRNRVKKISDFILGYFAIELSRDEFVEEIIIPKGSKRAASAFQKFGLTGDDWALINCGAYVELKESTIELARLCFGGGVGEKPKRIRSLEDSLAGFKPNEDGAEEKIRLLFEEKLEDDGLETISDIRASSEYRARLANVLGRRALLQAFERVKELSS